MTLQGWWPLHDQNAQDYSGNQNHGTLNGSPTTGVAGKGGLQATSFDGADDSISLPSGLLSVGDFTVSFWMKAGITQSSAVILLKNDLDAQIGSTGGQEISFNLYDGSDFTGPNSAYNLNEWVHVVAVYDNSSTTAKLYLNGVKEDSVNQGVQSKSTTSRIGSGNGANYFNGDIFGVRVYNRALTDAEIQTLYEWGSADLVTAPTPDIPKPTITNFTTQVK